MVVNILLSNESYTHKNWFYKDIFVNYSMVYYVLSGNAYYKDENGTFRLKANHLYIFPARKKFSLYDNPNNKLFHTYIHATTLPIISKFYEIKVEENTILSDSIALLRKYIKSTNKKVITSILDLVLTNALANNKQNDSIAYKIKKYIDENINSKITLDLISYHLAYSKGHINRIFNKEFNMSPIVYYNNQRLELSIKYLLEKRNAKEICTLINFASPAAFNKAFKIKYGLPPERYVETILKNR
jgi:AraC-like DNA-binding protein